METGNRESWQVKRTDDLPCLPPERRKRAYTDSRHL